MQAEKDCYCFRRRVNRRQNRQRNGLESTASSSNYKHGLLSPNIINEAPHLNLTEDEHYILKLGPRFIFNDPKTPSRRRTTELATLKRKLENHFFEKKVSPGRPVEEFINELDALLQNYYDIPAYPPPRCCLDLTINLNQSEQFIRSSFNNRRRRTNVNRTIKRLKHRFRSANVILRKTDKSKVFHLGKLEHYQQRSNEYMEKTQAYQCIGTNDPLLDLVTRTNKYLLDLRLMKWITQKQYEQLCVKADEAE